MVEIFIQIIPFASQGFSASKSFEVICNNYMNSTGGCIRNNELNNDGDQFKCSIATHEKGIIYCTNKASLEEYTCLMSSNISKYQRLFSCNIEKEEGNRGIETQKSKSKPRTNDVPILLDTSTAELNKIVENTNPFIESIKAPQEGSTIKNKANQSFQF